jgi:hypothetical protein
MIEVSLELLRMVLDGFGFDDPTDDEYAAYLELRRQVGYPS